LVELKGLRNTYRSKIKRVLLKQVNILCRQNQARLYWSI